jgi:uncharacterized membrane protein YfcA
MELLVGFAIALAISLTGVGAGSMTTPVLVLLLGVSPSIAVGTALAFGAIVKLVSAPVYLARRHVNLRILSFLLLGGLPGVVAGGLLLNRFKNGAYDRLLYVSLGTLIVFTAAFHLYRALRPNKRQVRADRSKFLPWLALPIGLEVGFSSAGAGALGSLLLLSFTPLEAVEIIGTDLCFGLGLSFVGSLIQVGAGNYDPALLLKLIVGGVLGAICGSLLSGRIAQRPLRVGLLLVLIFLGFQLATHKAATQQSGPKAAISDVLMRRVR